MVEVDLLIISLSIQNSSTLGLLSSRSSDSESRESGNEDGGELHFEDWLLGLGDYLKSKGKIDGSV